MPPTPPRQNPAHPFSLRHMDFTWDPETEPRSQIWNRIKRHVQQELDRIHAAAVLQRQVSRRQARPHAARNERILDAWHRGVSDRDIAREHGMRPQRVREIIRTEQRWYACHDPLYATLRDEHPARYGSALELQHIPGLIHQTHRPMTDP